MFIPKVFRDLFGGRKLGENRDNPIVSPFKWLFTKQMVEIRSS
jgi:hypothetical protein